MRALARFAARRWTERWAELWADNRGAIYVLGIVMGAVLFGVAWNLVNVGSAIAWRERAQDLADVAAYENALAHARGMNLLVMVNLLMVIVLSFLVIWRMLMLAMLAVAIPTFGLSLSVASFMSEQDRVLSATVHEFVQAGPYLQKVIALSTPHVAAQRAEALVREHYPVERLRSLRSVSASLFPSDLVARIGAAERASRPKLASSGVAPVTSGGVALPSLEELKVDPSRLLAFDGGSSGGFGLGLPVATGEWNALCNKGAQAAILRLGEGDFAIPGLNAVSAGLRGWGLDRAMGSALDPFCDDWNGARGRAISLATTACKTLGGGVAERFCSRVARAAVSPFFGGSASALSKVERPGLLEAPPQLENGNASAQSWSFVELDPEPWLGLSRQGLEVIDGARTGGVEPASRVVSAQFEMYFDCEDRWSRCAEDSLLRLAWRARGRSVNPKLASLLLGGALEMGSGRWGQVAPGAAGDMTARLQGWARAALGRALPEVAAIRQQLNTYGGLALELQIAEQVRGLIAAGVAPARVDAGARAGTTRNAPARADADAPSAGRPSPLAAAAGRILERLSGDASIIAH